MKASYAWLRALVPQIDVPPGELAQRLTSAGLEVEAMHAFGEGAKGCIVAKVVSVRPHPSKSGLRLVTVDRGNTTQEVVCGAPNVPEPGGLVVLAPIGTRLPAKGMTIDRRAIGGIESDGMLCSEAELGLTDESAGIIVLPGGAGEPGQPFAEVEPAAVDTIFEIGLTPNRPDGLGHIGLAREIAALYAVSWSSPERETPERVVTGSTDKLVKILVEDAERCPHYAAAAVIDVTIGPSPAWVRYRLSSLGVRPISNVVDVTNLTMLEYGHPMHAFDLERVRDATIIVRRAHIGEKLVTLEGVERTLVHDDLVICDGGGPVALAGVMGGKTSEIHAETRRVLFECAYFDPRGVRRTSRRHALHTESSHRFERGVDPGAVAAALTRAVALTTLLSPGSAAVPGAIHVEALKLHAPVVSLRSERQEQLLGLQIPWNEALAILERLGCKVVTRSAGAAELEMPTHRPDLTREVDLIEEVIRVRGIDAIPAVLPAIRPSREHGGFESLARRVRAAATELGLSEAITYSFTSEAALNKVMAPKPSVFLKNPLNENQTVMRTSLLPGLLEGVANARRRGENDVRLFTIGSIFLPSASGEPLPDERPTFAAVLAGSRNGYLVKPEPVDVWDAKGLAVGLVFRLAGKEPLVLAAAKDSPAHLHPRGAAFVEMQNARIGTLGPLHPDVAEAFDVGHDLVAVEIDLLSLADLRRAPRYQSIPRFPASTRDIALVVHDDVPAGAVEKVVRAAAGELAERVALFDRFTGGAIPKDHTSLAFHVVYRAPDRTLTETEVDQCHAKVVKEASAKFGATLRE